MDQVIEGLQTRKGELLAKIHLLNAECSNQFAKYQQLGEGQQDEEEASQLQALSNNILFMEAQVLQLNSNCKAAVASKKDKLSAIRKF